MDPAPVGAARVLYASPATPWKRTASTVPLAVAVRRFVHEPHAISGWPRPIAAGFHDALVRGELQAIRALDVLLGPAEDDAQRLSHTTALIKTFERPRIVQRLVASIRRVCPALRIVVVDDSGEPARIDGVEMVVMPYDSGISAGRNEGLQRITTKYVLLLDDDLVVFRGTRLSRALALMERHPDMDIMGGQLIDLPLLTARPLSQVAGSLLGAEPSSVPNGSRIGGLPVCEKVPNFFLARRERLKLVPWDPALKRMEHADFFTRASGVLTTVFNPALKAIHARTPFDADYMAKRLDLAASRKLLAERYGE